MAKIKSVPSSSRDTALRPGALSPSGASAVREANADLIAGLLRDRGPLSRADLVRVSGLARPTVDSIVHDLVAVGFATDSPRNPPVGARGGRPGVLLDFNAHSSTVAACRVRSRGFEVRLLDAHGHTLAESTAVLDREPTAFLVGAAKEIKRLHRSVAGAGPLGAVSVLMPGLINRSTGSCMAFPAWGWADVPVGATLRRRLGVPVSVLNPAAAAVIGEVTTGAGHGHQDVVLLFLDRGIGAGVLTGGQLLQGTDGAVGELGHCRVARPGLPCHCGRSGCLETVASGRVILEQAERILGPGGPATLAGLEALRNRRVDRVLAKAAADLGSATSWLVNLLNPSIVLIGGTPFCAGAEQFLATFRAGVQADTTSTNQSALSFALAADEADVHGAVHAALEQLPLRLRPRQRYGA